jgi:hypothetical protein
MTSTLKPPERIFVRNVGHEDCLLLDPKWSDHRLYANTDREYEYVRSPSPSKGEELKRLEKGMPVFWRWKNGKTFSEAVVQDKNGMLVSFGRWKEDIFPIQWINVDEIEWMEKL